MQSFDKKYKSEAFELPPEVNDTPTQTTKEVFEIINLPVLLFLNSKNFL